MNRYGERALFKKPFITKLRFGSDHFLINVLPSKRSYIPLQRYKISNKLSFFQHVFELKDYLLNMFPRNFQGSEKPKDTFRLPPRQSLSFFGKIFVAALLAMVLLSIVS